MLQPKCRDRVAALIWILAVVLVVFVVFSRTASAEFLFVSLEAEPHQVVPDVAKLVSLGQSHRFIVDAPVSVQGQVGSFFPLNMIDLVIVQTPLFKQRGNPEWFVGSQQSSMLSDFRGRQKVLSP